MPEMRHIAINSGNIRVVDIILGNERQWNDIKNIISSFMKTKYKLNLIIWWFHYGIMEKKTQKQKKIFKGSRCDRYINSLTAN